MSNKTCNLCSKIFSSKSNLNRHQKTSKHCLKIQSEMESTQSEDFIYQCEHCSYSTNLKYHFDRHNSSCKRKIQKQEEENINLKNKLLVAETKIEMLEADKSFLQKEVSKPKIIHNKTNNTKTNNVTLQMQMDYCKKNLAPYEEFLKHANEYAHKYFRLCDLEKGVDGVVVVLNKMLPPTDNTRYLVTFENAKQSFYRNKENKIELDDRANKFLLEVFPFVLNAAHVKYKSEVDDCMAVSDYPRCIKLCDKMDSIKRIGNIGSLERKKCVDAISRSFCISNRFLQLQEVIPSEQKYLPDSKDTNVIEECGEIIIKHSESIKIEENEENNFNTDIQSLNSSIKTNRGKRWETKLIEKYNKIRTTKTQEELDQFEATLNPEEIDILSDYLTKEDNEKIK